MSRLIDADALIMAIPDTRMDIFENCRNCKLLDKEEITAIINNAPTIEERHGHWNKEEDTLFRLCVYKCSLCGGEVLSEAYFFKYCPYCGAKMDEVEE